MKKALIRTLIILAAVAFTAVLAVILFLVAGRTDLPLLWVLIGIFSAIMVVSAATIDTGLLKERLRPGPGGIDGQVVIVFKLLLWGSTSPIPFRSFCRWPAWSGSAAGSGWLSGP